MGHHHPSSRLFSTSVQLTSLLVRCTHSNKKTLGLNSISFFKSETVINYRVMQMYLEWPRACSWIVDKNCIFHQRCFNYALIRPKKIQTPPDSIILVTMRICMDPQKQLRGVQKCHRRFIEGRVAVWASLPLASCPSIVLHRPLYSSHIPVYTLPQSDPASTHNQNLLSSLQWRVYIALICTWWQTWCIFTLHFQLNSPISRVHICTIHCFCLFSSFPSISHNTKHYVLCQTLFSWTNGLHCIASSYT